MKPQALHGQAHGGILKSRWTVPLAVLSASLAAVLFAFQDTLSAMVDIWNRSATFGHCYLIPVISLGVIWMRREAIAKLMPRPSAIGLAALLMLSGAWLLARSIGVAVGEQLVFVLILQALVLAILGWRVAWALAFPLFYLLFMVPFGEVLIEPLQRFTASFVTWWLRTIDIPVYTDGFFIHLPTGSFEVAEACAGLRYLIAMLALGTLFANITYTTWWRRAFFLLIAIVVPVIMNGFRALGIVLLAYATDNRVAVGVDHILYGWVFLSITTIAVLAIGMWMREATSAERRGWASDVTGATPAAYAAVIAAGLTAVVMASAGPALAHWRNDDRAIASLEIRLPERLATWERAPASPAGWRPAFVGADAEAVARYREDGRAVDVYVAYYGRQRQDAELVNATHRLAAEPDWVRAGTHGLSLTLGGSAAAVEAARLISTDGERRLVVPVYWVSHRFATSAIGAKLLQAWSIPANIPEAAAIVISAPYLDGPEEAAEDLRSFAEGLGALGESLAAAAPQ